LVALDCVDQLEVLTNFVRECLPHVHASNVPDQPAIYPRTSLPVDPDTDVQIALDALAGRPVRPDRERAHLHLHRLHLQGAWLSEARLQGADLNGANLQDAHLDGAQLQGADLTDADLRGADLTGANLQGGDRPALRRSVRRQQTRQGFVYPAVIAWARSGAMSRTIRSKRRSYGWPMYFSAIRSMTVQAPVTVQRFDDPAAHVRRRERVGAVGDGDCHARIPDQIARLA
jgi:hypothetical protein